MTTAEAPAKVNLTLRVTGRRPDGFHLLDSLVVFAPAAADRLRVEPATGLRLDVTGPMAAGVPPGEGNLVLRAARALREARGVTAGAAITLEKHLPHGAGLGGGSSDAAAALRALAAGWGVTPLSAGEALALGADVPVCLGAPAPARMSGIGDVLDPVPPLPEAALVLVNPGVPVPTAAVFARLDLPPARPVPTPEWPDVAALADWVAAAGNDLLPAAREIAPPIAQALDALRRTGGCRVAGMSGSGATCFGLFDGIAPAARAARALAAAQPGWWVAASPIARDAGAARSSGP